MTSLLASARCGALGLLLGTVAPAATFIVDASNGPGTQFTQIQPAIAAASPGDVILVRAGFYKAFTLSVGLSIVADKMVAPDIVVVDPGCVIRRVPAGQTARLKDLFLGNLKILDCAGLVVADGVGLTPPSTVLGPGDTSVLDIQRCADVRMRQLGINPGNGSGRHGVVVRDARFEVDGAAIDGARGPTLAPGGTGLRCEAGSVVNVSFSQVRGGQVGAGGPIAGAGIHVAAGATLAVNGTIENRIIGGFGGSCGPPGPAFFVEAGASVRVSHRVKVDGGTSNCFPTGAQFAGPGSAVIANPTDLAMVFDGGFGPLGVPARLVVLGEPQAQAVLLAGVAPAQLPVPPFRANPLLVQPALVLPLGAIPATGLLFVPLQMPGNAPLGSGVLLQAGSLRPNGDLFLSNSTVLVFR